MKQQFPIFKTKIKGVNKEFDLTDPKEQKEYFKLKAGKEIEKLREYLKKNTFIVYLLGKKNSGKGTYAKMFAEVVWPEKIAHFSVGDMIRGIDEELEDPGKKKELIDFLKANYRGRFSLNEIIHDLENRDTITLRPTELILSLVKREIGRKEKKALFIDGFPRDLDQISYSLFFRDLIGYRDDPDIFILIDVPDTVIDARIKSRVICPGCKTPRNSRLLISDTKVEYDRKADEFYLICEKCGNQRMVPKEGDELGVKAIKERLKIDENLMERAFSLYGIPKVLLRNSVPTERAKDFIDDCEITPEYNYQWDEKNKKVKIIKKPWTIPDDNGIPSYSLLAQPVAVSLIKQMVDILNL